MIPYKTHYNNNNNSNNNTEYRNKIQGLNQVPSFNIFS